MKSTLRHYSGLLLAALLCTGSFGSLAQTTVTLAPSTFGTVDANGLTVTGSLTCIKAQIAPENRGYVRFDLSSLAGATIQSANLVYSTLGSTVNSAATNFLTTLSTDPATLSGSSLFSSLVAGGGATNIFTGAWSGTHPLTLQTDGPIGGGPATAADLMTYLNNAVMTGYAGFGIIRGSSNCYDFQTPMLTLTYIGGTPCAGVPSPGTIVSSALNVCNGTPFNLSVSGATSASGLAFQYQSSAPGANSFSDISGANTGFYTATQTATSDYRLRVNLYKQQRYQLFQCNYGYFTCLAIRHFYD